MIHWHTNIHSFILTHTCILILSHIHAHIFIHIHIYTHLLTHRLTPIYTFTHTLTHEYLCSFIHTSIYLFTHPFTQSHTDLHVHLHTHSHSHSCIYTLKHIHSDTHQPFAPALCEAGRDSPPLPRLVPHPQVRLSYGNTVLYLNGHFHRHLQRTEHSHILRTAVAILSTGTSRSNSKCECSLDCADTDDIVIYSA